MWLLDLESGDGAAVVVAIKDAEEAAAVGVVGAGAAVP